MAEYSDELFDEICERIAGGESLASICRDKKMPSQTAVYKWLQKDDGGELVEKYTRARELQGDSSFDSVLDVGRQVIAGTIAPDQARVAIDTLKWAAGKLRPKKYGDRVDHTHSIEKIERIEVEVVSAPMRDVTPKEIEQS